MRPWRLKNVFFGLAANLVLSPKLMKDFFIVTQLKFVKINVPLALEFGPSMTFKRLVCHTDVAFIICVTVKLLDVTTILMLAGHHVYSWPESVLNVEFPRKKTRVKPVI